MEENQNLNSVSNKETTKMNPNLNGKKKGKGKILLIIVILLIIAIVGGLIYYFAIYTKPDKIYKRLVQSSINSYTNKRMSMDYQTFKTSLKLNTKLDLQNNQIDPNMLDLINQTTIGMDLQADNEQKQFLMNIKADYDKDSLLDFEMYSNVDKEETYMQLKNWFDKYIVVENLNEEFYTSLRELLTNPKIESSKKQNIHKSMKIVKEELTNAIKKEYCTAQKEDITVKGKTIHATKNTLKMNVGQLKKEMETVLNHLKDNQEFMECFKDEDKILDMLDNFSNQLEEIEDEDSTIEISIYTNGLIQEMQKFTLTIYDAKTNEELTMAFTKLEFNTYLMEMLEQEETILTGKITIQVKDKKEGTIDYELEIPNFGKVKLNLEYRQVFDEKIEEVDVRNSVKAEELTSEDQKNFITNFQKSKLYELIGNFTNNRSSSNNFMETESKNNMTDDENRANNNDNETSTMKENEILSYDEAAKIRFKIPVGYQSRTVSDNYKVLEKDDILINIFTTYADKDGYYEELEESKQYYEEQDSIDNVVLSEIKNIEVNGREFYYATLSYEYSFDSKVEQMYVWSEISDEMVLNFEVRGLENLTNEELKEILTVTIENNR